MKISVMPVYHLMTCFPELRLFFIHDPAGTVFTRPTPTQEENLQFKQVYLAIMILFLIAGSLGLHRFSSLDIEIYHFSTISSLINTKTTSSYGFNAIFLIQIYFVVMSFLVLYNGIFVKDSGSEDAKRTHESTKTSTGPLLPLVLDGRRLQTRTVLPCILLYNKHISTVNSVEFRELCVRNGVLLTNKIILTFCINTDLNVRVKRVSYLSILINTQPYVLKGLF